MKYDCAECINRQSPLCKNCGKVTSPSGEESRPTYYVSEKAAGKNTADVVWLAGMITGCVMAGRPIPFKWVAAYNNLFVPAEEGKQ